MKISKWLGRDISNAKVANLLAKFGQRDEQNFKNREKTGRNLTELLVLPLKHLHGLNISSFDLMKAAEM